MEHDVIFEVLPYASSASENSRKKVVDRIADAVAEMKRVKMLNIPEIVEENHNGEPFYRNWDNRKFGLMLKERCGKEIIVNSAVSYHNPKERFGEWLDESISEYGLENYIFVGQKIGALKYPGPSVLDADKTAKGKSINFGNIFIPERENEAERLLAKTRSGCSFFTSQLLFEPGTAMKILGEYSSKCLESGINPAKIYLSYAPVSSSEDILFLKWLGAHLSRSTEAKLKSCQNIAEGSIMIILSGLHRILDFAEEQTNVPIGLNIGYVTLHNLELARDLVQMVTDIKLPIVK